MKLFCVWEHNGADSLVFVENLPGAFSRGASKEEALAKIPVEAGAWLRWAGKQKSENFQMEVIQEISTDAEIRDGDSNGLFEREKLPLTMEEYERMKRLSLRSAQASSGFIRLCRTKKKHVCPPEKPFMGRFPAQRRQCISTQSRSMPIILVRLAWRLTMREILSSAGNEGLPCWSSSPDFWKTPFFWEATMRSGRSAKCCGVFSGTTVSMPKLLLEWSERLLTARQSPMSFSLPHLR